MDKETLSMLVDVVISCAVIMALIVAACLVTPKIAKFIEKRCPKLAEKTDPARVDGENKGVDPKDYKVQGAFESSKLEGFDPNYKIYNQDIYGFDFKRKKHDKGGENSSAKSDDDKENSEKK